MGQHRLPVLQAKVVGGGSTINGMHAQRGLPRDYDDWSRLGVQGWSWTDVLPYFKKLETDFDYSGPLHGNDGPIQIRRVPESQWSPLTLALREALERRGIPRVTDVNSGGGDCTAPVPINSSSGKRSSAAVSYLDALVRKRRNLTIVTNNLAIPPILPPEAIQEIYVLGGQYKVNLVSTIGAVGFRSGDISVDTAIIGISGMTARKGIATTVLEETSMLAEMISAAGRIIVLADASKFGRTAFGHFAPLSAIDI